MYLQSLLRNTPALTPTQREAMWVHVRQALAHPQLWHHFLALPSFFRGAAVVLASSFVLLTGVHGWTLVQDVQAKSNRQDIAALSTEVQDVNNNLSEVVQLAAERDTGASFPNRVRTRFALQEQKAQTLLDRLDTRMRTMQRQGKNISSSKEKLIRAQQKLVMARQQRERVLAEVASLDPQAWKQRTPIILAAKNRMREAEQSLREPINEMREAVAELRRAQGE